MSKILNINDMLQAAEDSSLPSFDRHVEALEEAAQELALALARHHEILVRRDATWMSTAFAGLCASFGPAFKGQPCPAEIDEADEQGDWE